MAFLRGINETAKRRNFANKDKGLDDDPLAIGARVTMTPLRIDISVIQTECNINRLFSVEEDTFGNPKTVI